MIEMLTISLILPILSIDALAFDWTSLKLPASHLPYYFTNQPHLENQCSQDDNCPYKEFIHTGRCFGYEEDCDKDNQYKPVNCPDRNSWHPKKSDQVEKFWETGDFGIVSLKRSLMRTLCASNKPEESDFECEMNARYCRGRNIVVDLREVKKTRRNDLQFLRAGAIGGKCRRDRTPLNKEWKTKNHKEPLQSWLHIADQFSHMSQSQISDCDIVIDKPTYILQTDQMTNMYHHFCDFVNLYLTQHLNSTSLELDNNIIIWNTSGKQHFDHFEAFWKVFTKNHVNEIGDYIGKKVCLRDMIFALPPRQPQGLFFNMPLVGGCYGSGLFRAFHEHSIHRMGVQQKGPKKDKLRITFLSRKSKHRNILNQQELLDALNENPLYEAKMVYFEFVSKDEDHIENFRKQVEISHNTDILVGIHGAGLTNLLFLPNWAAIVEVYHCGDPNCYKNLARLRGIKHVGWTQEKKMESVMPDEKEMLRVGQEWPKSANFSFDVDEFVRLVEKAADHVRQHEEFKASRHLLEKPLPKEEL